MSNDNTPGKPDLKVVAFKSLAAETNEAAIKLLEEYLEDAKKGDIVEVAIAGLLSDGGMSIGATKSHNCPGLLGAISRLLYLQHKNIDNYNDQ